MSWRVVAYHGRGPWDRERGLQVGDLVVVHVAPSMVPGALVVDGGQRPLTPVIGEVVDLDVNRKGKLLRVHVQLRAGVAGPPVTVVRHPQRVRLTRLHDRPRPRPALYLAAADGRHVPQEMIG